MAASMRHDTTCDAAGNRAVGDRAAPPNAVAAAIEAHLAQQCRGESGPSTVEHVETHLSHVFLVGESVYKLLKPVKFAFVDFSTIDRRGEECRAEVELNRPLAGDVYLSAEPVRRLADGGVRLGGVQIGGVQIGGDVPDDGRDSSRAPAGEIVDWTVVMRRLPADRTLEALAGRGEATADQMAELAAVLARFYRSAARAPLAADEYIAAVEHHVRDNCAELSRCEHALPRHEVARVCAAQRMTLFTRASWFRDRVEAGRIIEGHGDLRPEHVYFLPHPVVIDCLAFSRELRTLDAADEVAFLAMELQRLGAEELAAAFVAAYQRISADQPPKGLWNFYRAYRACVRAKVAVLRGNQLDEPQRSEQRAAARAFLDLADRETRPLQRPLCVIVRGLSGTGKSTLAAALAEKLGAAHLQTDAVRKQLFPGATPTEYGRGCYTTAARAMVYDAMLAQARELLVEGIPVVLDGTFLTVQSRTGAVAAASRKGAPTVTLVCGCPLEVAAQRIADRAAMGRSESDAREATLRQQATEEEPDSAATTSTTVDTTVPLEEQLAAALAAICAAIGEGPAK